MSYQQKKTLVSITCGLVLFLVYCFTILPVVNKSGNSDDLQQTATKILLFIGVAIVVNIVIQIIFHILLSVSIAVEEKVKDSTLEDKKFDKLVEKRIKQEMVEDERVKQIERKSLQVGYYLTGFGIVISIGALAMGQTAIVMLNILFLSCMLGSIIEGAVQLYFYSKE